MTVPSLVVVIDRTALSMSALVISNAPTASGLRISLAGRPVRDLDRTYATSNFTAPVMTRATPTTSALPLTLYAQAATAAELDDLRDELDAALGQWRFDITVTEAGVAKVYGCDQVIPAWNEYDSGMASGLISRATVTIPCDVL